MRSPARAKRIAAFTLVELLAVISIIALLAVLLMAGIRRGGRFAKEGATRSEVKNLEMAMTQYWSDWGEYPPDRTDGSPQPNAEKNLKPGQCLVYYLGEQFRASDGFTRNAGAYFNFDVERLSSHVNGPVYQDLLTADKGDVYYYRFDNNEADNGSEAPWTTAPWNVTNVNHTRVDIWSSGMDRKDEVSGLKADLTELAADFTPLALHSRRSSAASLKGPVDNDSDGKTDEDPIDTRNNDSDGKTDEDPPEDFIGNW